MIRIAVLFSLLVPLAACGTSSQSASFPDDYLGRWGENARSCAPGAVHGGLTIKGDTVIDGEFSGKVRSVTAKPDRTIDVAELWDVPENGPTTFVTNYRLSDDKKSLTARQLAPTDGNVAQPMTLVRCAALR